MLEDLGLYGVSVDDQEEPVLVQQKHTDIVHSAVVLLEKCQLIKYEHASGQFQSTKLGKIASYHYVTYNLVMVCIYKILETKLVGVFSHELIPVRQEVSLMCLGWLAWN